MTFLFKPMSLDIETTGLDYAADVLSVGIAYRADDGEIVRESWPLTAGDLFHAGMTVPQLRAKLLPHIQRSTIIFGHNFAFDLSYLFKLGILRPDEVKLKVFDTLSTGRMTGAHDRYNLAALCTDYGIGDDPAWHASKVNRKHLKNQDVETLLEYQGKDCLYQLMLGEAMYTRATQLGYSHDFLMRESDFCRVVANMRVLGQALDLEKTKARIDAQMAVRQKLNREILYPAKLHNVNASSVILNYLRHQGIAVQSYTKKGNAELDSKALKALKVGASPEVCAVLDAVATVKGIEKEVNTWLLPFIEYAKEDGSVHANFTVSGAASHRITCSNPGLLAIPDMDIWQPRLAADYSQAEYRLAAMYAKYTDLAKGYAKGLDAHTITASLLLGRPPANDLERKNYGKTINFLILYGGGKDLLALRTGLPTDAAAALRKQMKNKLKPMFDLFYRVKEAWEENGYIKLWTGKRIYSVGWDKRSYKALNQLCQGGVAELAKEAMMAFDALGIPMINQIYDAIYFPPNVDPERVVNVMSNILPQGMENKTTPPIKMLVDVKRKPEEKLQREIEVEQDETDYTEVDDSEVTQPDQLVFA